MVDLKVTTMTGSEATLDEAAVEGLKASLRGEITLPSDDGYDEARKLYNAMIDRRPSLIVRCAGVADVINSVNFAALHLELERPMSPQEARKLLD